MFKHTFNGVITTDLNEEDFQKTFKEYMSEAEEAEVGSLEVTSTEEVDVEEEEDEDEEEESEARQI